MPHSKRERGSAATAVMLSLVLVAMVVLTVIYFRNPLYHPPAPITEIGKAVDHQYDLTLYVTATVFVLSQLGLALAVFMFRDKGRRAHFTRGNNTMEFLWTSATIILFLGLGILGRKAWADTRFTEPQPDAIPIEVTANQFVFNFRYAGPDGKFGKLDPKLISASTGNPLGIDPADPAGKDDIVVPLLPFRWIIKSNC
jgi:cytochrome c oxidase subunit II